MHNPIPIRVEMAKQNLTGEQLAEMAGVSRPTISKIVHGKNVLPNKLKAVAAVLGLRIEDLFNLEAKRQEAESAAA